MPATPADAKGLLKTAIRDPDPVVFIEHSLLYSRRGPVPEGDDHLVPLGESAIVREGTDVTLVAYSRMLLEALAAAEEMAGYGIECEVVDLRTLRPLDLEPVAESVSRTHHAVVCGEDWRTGGFGASLAAEIQDRCFESLDAPVARVAMADVPLPYARNLEKMLIPTAHSVTEAVRGMLSIGGRR
jgi:pyruvate/2-oxoglutarate/acetoin dehydrogenase E1 component